MASMDYNRMEYKDGVLTVYCSECGHMEKVRCSERQLRMLQSGRECVQAIFPTMDPDIREMFTRTGWCGVCFSLNTGEVPFDKRGELLRDIGKILGGRFAGPPESLGDIKEILTELEWEYEEGEEKDRELCRKIREKVKDACREGP